MAFSRSILISLVAQCCVANNAFAADQIKPELLLIGGTSDQDTWIAHGPYGQKNAVGFEYFHTFSDDYGDVLSADLQVRFPYDAEEPLDDALGVEIHNAWLQWKLGLGRWVRVGHFDPAFGLEPVLDTHGTILQSLAPESIGYKKDWGIGYRTIWGDYDVEVAAQSGSGMGLRRKDEPYLLSGRLSGRFENDWEWGLSLLHGETLASRNMWTIPAPPLVSQDASQKTLFGCDMQGDLHVFRVMGETAVGEQDDRTVGGAMLQGDYTLPEHQQVDLKLQAKAWSHDLDDSDRYDVTLGAIAQYAVNASLTLRLGYLHDLHKDNAPEDRMLLLQLYYLSL